MSTAISSAEQPTIVRAILLAPADGDAMRVKAAYLWTLGAAAGRERAPI